MAITSNRFFFWISIFQSFPIQKYTKEQYVKNGKKIMPPGKIYRDLDTAECAVNIKMGKNEV